MGTHRIAVLKAFESARLPQQSLTLGIGTSRQPEDLSVSFHLSELFVQFGESKHLGLMLWPLRIDYT
jgi:hypothetical protein